MSKPEESMGESFDGVVVEKKAGSHRALEPTNAGDRRRNSPKVFEADAIGLERRDIVDSARRNPMERSSTKGRLHSTSLCPKWDFSQRLEPSNRI